MSKFRWLVCTDCINIDCRRTCFCCCFYFWQQQQQQQQRYGEGIIICDISTSNTECNICTSWWYISRSIRSTSYYDLYWYIIWYCCIRVFNCYTIPIIKYVLYYNIDTKCIKCHILSSNARNCPIIGTWQSTWFTNGSNNEFMGMGIMCYYWWTISRINCICFWITGMLPYRFNYILDFSNSHCYLYKR